MSHEWRRGEYVISDDHARLDVDVIHGYLKSSYWAAGRPLERVVLSIEHSLPLGLYKDDRQIGFARVVTDRATFAYLADVFVLEEFRGAGLGKWLVQIALAHPDLQNLRRWMLATKDAHGLYRQFGFTELKEPERWMTKE
jgi:GNAT superfamily N-acetyltransferase